jgi:CTP synthase (UTP-ammonia lyase)
MPALQVCVVLDSPAADAYHVATLAALDHAADALSVNIATRVTPSDRLRDGSAVESNAAIVIGPGSPYRDPDAVLATIRCARERGVPLVGT